jgi:hypothetical protein
MSIEDVVSSCSNYLSSLLKRQENKYLFFFFFLVSTLFNLVILEVNPLED